MTPDRPITVFVVVANTSETLSAYRWSMLHADIAEMLNRGGATFVGEWYSGPVALFQNACWCVQIQPGVAERLKGELGAIGAEYGRGLIGWSEVDRSAILG